MYNIEDAKIIGITGQVGKTSTAILLHEYLKSIGRKSIIYSSGLIDSPANANIKTNNCLQNLTFGDEYQIANILNEAIAYEAEYIIIECWESSIFLGCFDSVPFDLKVLTKLFGTGDCILSGDELFERKLNFFKDEQFAKCLINIKGCYENKINEFISRANMKDFKLFDTTLDFNLSSKAQYINWFNNDAGTRKLLDSGYKAEDIKYYGLNNVESLDEQSLDIVVNKNIVPIKTNLITQRHLENIITVAAILNELNDFDAESFKTFISDEDLIVPGRMEKIEWNDRTIIIDMESDSCLRMCKKLGNGRPIKVVDAQHVTHSILDEEFKERYHTKLHTANKWSYAPKITNEFADYVYITVDNVGDESVEAVLSEYEKRSTIPHSSFESRADGIKTALLESEPNDIICIVGRGNSTIQARSYNDIILYNDKDVIMKFIDILSD